MSDEQWEKIIEEKIETAKQRGSRKRGWVKLDSAWLTSSINYRMDLSEIAVFSKLIVMADAFGPVAGLISDNDFRPMPHEYLAHQACCPLEVFEETIKKGVADDSIYENSHGIFVTHFDDYQFTEYDRQKPSRVARREAKKAAAQRSFKECPDCHYLVEVSKVTERMEVCPQCKKKGKEVLLVVKEGEGKNEN